MAVPKEAGTYTFCQVTLLTQVTGGYAKYSSHVDEHIDEHDGNSFSLYFALLLMHKNIHYKRY